MIYQCTIIWKLVLYVIDCSVPQSIEQAYNSKHHLDRSNMNRVTKHQNYIHVCQNNEI